MVKKTPAQNIQEAKRLLTEAGYGPDKPLEFTLLYNTSELHKKTALAIASMWQQALGIKINLINKEWKTYLDDRREGNFDIARAGWYGDYNEPSTMLNLFFSTNNMNQGHYLNPKFDALMLDSIKELNAEKRAVFTNKRWRNSIAICHLSRFINIHPRAWSNLTSVAIPKSNGCYLQ